MIWIITLVYLLSLFSINPINSIYQNIEWGDFQNASGLNLNGSLEGLKSAYKSAENHINILKSERLLMDASNSTPINLQSVLEKNNIFSGDLNDKKENLLTAIKKVDVLYQKYTSGDCNFLLDNEKSLDSLKQLLKDIEEASDKFGPSNKNIFEQLVNEINNHLTEVADDGLSFQQRLYVLYYDTVIAAYQIYTLKGYLYYCKSEKSKTLHEIEVGNYRNRFECIFNKSDESINNVLHLAPKFIFRNDAQSRMPGTTDLEMKGTFNAYIINEADMRGNTCTQVCEDYKETELGTCMSGFCHSGAEACQGTLINCRRGGDMKVCPAANSYYPKRYHWFTDFNGVVNGDNQNDCKNGNGLKTLSSWKRGLRRCDYCVCTCTEYSPRGNAVRAVSLMEQTSDIENDRVVTGVQFKVLGGMLHLQIQEGLLLPGGSVSFTSWKDLQNITIDRENRFYRTVNNHDSVLNYRLDYELITTSLNSFHLEDIDDLPIKHVVTGVRIVKSENNAFGLEVQATAVDLKKGVLIDLKKNLWISNRKLNAQAEQKKKYTELKLENPSNPLKTTVHKMNLTPNLSVKLQMSDLKSTAGGYTVPFFDGQPVMKYPPSPLAGVGIFHRGAKGSGGLIAPKIFTYDLTSM